MSSTTQLHRERSADLDYPHLVAVVLAEQRHRAHRLRLVEVGDECVHRVVGGHRLVRDDLDVLLLRFRQRALPGEVETQVARLVQRAGLNRVGAEHLSQRGVHHVRAGVALGGTLAPRGVDLREHDVALGELALLHGHLVDPQLLGDLLDVVDLHPQARAGEGTEVGDLSTRLRVQGAAVEDDLDVLAGRRDGDPLRPARSARERVPRRPIRGIR